ncbi:hypothetical protein ACRRTK_017927 [Alexandromys fortis]
MDWATKSHVPVLSGIRSVTGFLHFSFEPSIPPELLGLKPLHGAHEGVYVL